MASSRKFRQCLTPIKKHRRAAVPASPIASQSLVAAIETESLSEVACYDRRRRWRQRANLDALLLQYKRSKFKDLKKVKTFREEVCLNTLGWRKVFGAILRSRAFWVVERINVLATLVVLTLQAHTEVNYAKCKAGARESLVRAREQEFDKEYVQLLRAEAIFLLTSSLEWAIRALGRDYTAGYCMVRPSTGLDFLIFAVWFGERALLDGALKMKPAEVARIYFLKAFRLARCLSFVQMAPPTKRFAGLADYVHVFRNSAWECLLVFVWLAIVIGMSYCTTLLQSREYHENLLVDALRSVLQPAWSGMMTFVKMWFHGYPADTITRDLLADEHGASVLGFTLAVLGWFVQLGVWNVLRAFLIERVVDLTRFRHSSCALTRWAKVSAAVHGIKESLLEVSCLDGTLTQDDVKHAMSVNPALFARAFHGRDFLSDLQGLQTTEGHLHIDDIMVTLMRVCEDSENRGVLDVVVERQDIDNAAVIETVLDAFKQDADFIDGAQTSICTETQRLGWLCVDVEADIDKIRGLGGEQSSRSQSSHSKGSAVSTSNRHDTRIPLAGARAKNAVSRTTVIGVEVQGDDSQPGEPQQCVGHLPIVFMRWLHLWEEQLDSNIERELTKALGGENGIEGDIGCRECRSQEATATSHTLAALQRRETASEPRSAALLHTGINESQGVSGHDNEDVLIEERLPAMEEIFEERSPADDIITDPRPEVRLPPRALMAALVPAAQTRHWV